MEIISWSLQEDAAYFKLTGFKSYSQDFNFIIQFSDMNESFSKSYYYSKILNI